MQRTVSARGITKLQDLWQSRELLRNLVVRDLKVRYKNSVLGIAWSMVTPLALVLIFSFVFTRVFRSPIKDFPVFVLAGLLPWQYLSNSISGSVGSIVGNADLIRKIYFPREVLSLSSVMSQAVHFLLSLVVFGVYMIWTGYNMFSQLHFLVLAFVLQTIFVAGIGMAVAAVNVSFRDLQELLGVILLAWFYATPVIYSLEMVPEPYRSVLSLNPMTWYIALYRQALYHLAGPSAKLILVCSAAGFLSLTVGYLLFGRLSVTFAKEV